MAKISFNASRDEENSCAWMEQLLSMSPCPILRIGKYGKVLYANEASAFLMKLWGISRGDKVPPEIEVFARKTFQEQSPFKLEVKDKAWSYTLMFSPIGEEYMHIYGLEGNCPGETWKGNCRLEKQHKQYKTSPEPENTSKSGSFLSGISVSSSISGSSNAVSSTASSDISANPPNPYTQAEELNSGNPPGSPGFYAHSCPSGVGSPSVSVKRNSQDGNEPEKEFKMQKMLWTIINNSPAVVFFWKNEDEWPAEFVSENVTQFGYTVEDFTSGNFLYGNIIHRDDICRVCTELRRCVDEDCDGFKMEYRIFTKEGELRWVDERTFIQRDSGGNVLHFQGVLLDITERKHVEEALKKAENFRKKEIHHRIKNNLQVISSLLDLQAEKFDDEEVVKAFRESESRVISISLIHEELYKSGNLETLNFSSYLHRLTEDLFRAYGIKGSDIKLHLDADTFFLGVDTAVSLGIIINELLISSLKNAFPEGSSGEISIVLRKEKSCPNMVLNGKESSSKLYACKETMEIPRPSYESCEYFELVYSDNGKTLPKKMDLKNPDTLGLQLVNALVEQIEGELDLERDRGTAFTIRFRNKTPPHESRCADEVK